jgi:dipeptidyl aminopeptidase/acylaminoacyl peptidase
MPSSTIRSIETAKPSPTLHLSATPAPNTTASPTPLFPAASFVQNCITVEDWSPGIFEVYGKLVQRCEEGACTLEFGNQGITQAILTPITPDFHFSRVSFSPDGKWLAYEEVTLKEDGVTVQGRQLRIVSANGQELPVVRWEPDWRLARWSDTETIIVELESELDPDYQVWMGDKDHRIILFKPLTGETKELLLPGLQNPYEGDLLLKGPQENYDLTFERVAYLYGDTISGYLQFALWDIQNDTLLWKRRSVDEMLFGTNWSPDGQWLAVASEVKDLKAEMFLVDRDGHEEQMTDLISTYSEMNINIGNFSWSPDGRYISLWLNVREGEYYGEWRFAVLNVETRQLVDYCFPSSPNQYPYAIWSPNSRQVAFQSYVNDDLSDPGIIILDVEKEEARKMPSRGFLWGWMVSEP